MTPTMQEVEIGDPVWMSFVESHPQATAFHHPEWARLIADCYGYRASALVMTDRAGDILAGLPLVRVNRPVFGAKAISLPFTDVCPPLFRADQAADTLARALADWRNGRHPSGQPLFVRSEVPEVAGWVQRQVAVVHTLPLSNDAQSVFRTFKRTQVQQCIIKAERDGVTVRCAESFDDLRLFYRLHTETRRRLGAPVQPLRIFRLIWERLLTAKKGFVLLAFLGGVPIAGAVFLAWNGTLIYKYSASDPQFWRVRPNNLVLWTAIRWACENGYRLMDFGRTDLENKGLRAFKNGWGTTEQPLIYSEMAGRRSTFSGADRLRPAVGHVLSSIIQRSPAWTCRLAGELLYKYAT